MADEGVDVKRYLRALRRSRLLIFLIVAVATGAAFLASFEMPSRYRATATLALAGEDASGLVGRDAATVRRELNTISTLITTREVLRRAAADVGGDSADDLSQRVTAAADPEANLIHVSATDSSATGAARLANAVANSFVARHGSLQKGRLEEARNRLVEELERLEREGARDREIEAIQGRIADVALAEVASASSFEIIEAEPPATRSSPRPVFTAVLAFAASLFFAILLVLARDQFSDRIRGAKELSDLADLPLIGSVPTARRLRPERSSNQQAYDYIQAVVRLALPAHRQQVILVTSAGPEDEKSRFVIGVARALHASRTRVLVVSADTATRQLDELLNLGDVAGLSGYLERAERGQARLTDFIADISGGTGSSEGDSRLEVLPGGTRASAGPHFLAAEALASAFEEIRRHECDYVLIDGAPLSRSVEAHLISNYADAVILVVPVERTSREQAADAGDVVRSLRAPPLGVVAVGDRLEESDAVRPPPFVMASSSDVFAAPLRHRSRE